MAHIGFPVLLLFLWSQAELTLTNPVCSKLPTVQDASVSTEYLKDHYQQNDVIYFSCDPGFTTRFNTSYACTEDGWRAQSFGRCIVAGSSTVRLGCAPPPPPENGRYFEPPLAFYEHGQTTHFECEPPYTMRGRSTRTCSDGRWSDDIQCLDVSALLRELSARLGGLQAQVEELKAINKEQASKLLELQTKTSEVDPMKEQLKRLQTKTNEVDPVKEQLRRLQTNEVDPMKEQLRHLQTKTNEVDPMKEQLRRLQTNEVDPMKEQLRRLQTNEVDPMKEQLRRLQTNEVDPMKEQLKEQAAELQSLKTERTASRVAFSASLLASGKGYTGPFTSHTILEYKNVFVNVGNAYNPDTGTFTAPMKGVYHFEFNFGTDGPPGGTVYLVKNTSTMCMATEKPSDGQYGSSGNEISLFLESGDTVYLRLFKERRIYENENHLCTFSGRLLFPV